MNERVPLPSPLSSNSGPQRTRRAPRWEPPCLVLETTLREPKAAEPRLCASSIATMRRRTPELLAGRLRSFIGRVPEHLALIGLELRRGEHATPRVACERLGSDARSVGADGLAERAAAIHRAATRGDLEGARAQLAAAEAEFRALFPQVFALMNQPLTHTQAPPLTKESHDPDPSFANY